MRLIRESLKLLRKNIMFEVVFVTTMLSLSLATFLTLCKSLGTLQRSVFYWSGDTFMDFFNVLKYIAQRDPYHSGYLPMSEKAYPPLTYMLLYPFSKLFDYVNQDPKAAEATQLGIMSVVIFLVFLSIVFACLIYEFKKGNKIIRFLTMLALFASGIYLFSLERANIVILSAICVLFFIMFYKSQNRILRELSYVALAIAAALKVYPAILGILLIYDKKFFAALRLGVYGIVATFAPFLYFKGGFSDFQIMIANLKLNAGVYTFYGYVYRFGFASDGILFNLSKTHIYTMLHFSYLLLAIAVLTAWSFKTPWKTILLLTCVLVTVPVNSGYYCGLYLFIPIVMFLNVKEHQITDWFYLFLMILILNPYQIIYKQVYLTTTIANISVLLICFILCIEGIIRSAHYLVNKYKSKKNQGSIPDKVSLEISN